MTIPQFFVYKRPVAWTALIASLVWGYFAYRAMPQRHDPIIPIRIATVITIYPGAEAEKVEQEVTRKIEKQLSRCGKVEKVYSLSRQNLSVVFVELFESVRDTEQVWQDLQGRLDLMNDLPTVMGRPLKPRLNKDFGESVAMMLTISSPKVSDFEISERAKSICSVLASFRDSRPEALRKNRLTAVLVYPNTVGRSYVLWLGQSLLQRLTAKGLLVDGQIVEAPSTGCLDFQLAPGVSEEQVVAECLQWDHDTARSGVTHPDIWPGILVRDLGSLETKLRHSTRAPTGRPDRYSYRDLRRFADLIRDRLKQYHTIDTIDELGLQDEVINLFYSGRRFSSLETSPQAIAQRLIARNINLPGGQVETPDQKVVVHPHGEFKSEQEVGEVVLDAPRGYPTYLRDVVDIVRGYEDPPNVMNFRSVKVDADDPPEAKMPGELHFALDDKDVQPPSHSRLQTTRAITLAVRQIKGSHIEQFAKDVDAAMTSLHGLLPEDLRIEWTHNEPEEVREKIQQFVQNLIEAIVIVVIVALLFMEWRSALLVAISIPVTVAITLGLAQLMGIDLQQVSIAAMIIALGLLVDYPVVAGDAINREIAHGQPRDVAAWLGPQRLARAIFYATVTNCVAYLPLLLVKGKTGDFIYSLPVVVTLSLVVSWGVSMTFMPLLGAYVLRGQKGFESGTEGKGFGARFARGYRAFSRWSLNHKAISLGAALLLLVGGCISLSSVGTAFFPKDLHSIFTVNVYLAEGTPIRKTEEESLHVIQEIERLVGDKVSSYTTFVGQGGPRFWLSIVPEQRSDGYAQILVHTVNSHVTQELVNRLKKELPPRLAMTRVNIEQLETGPPIGIPVQIRLFGDDIAPLRRIADEIKGQLRQIPGTNNVHDDWEAEVAQVSVTISPDRANLTGITHTDIALLLQTGLSGLAPTYLREEDRLIPIMFRLRADERARIDDIVNLDVVSAATNVRVPLREIAQVSTDFVSPNIRRRDHQRCITVKCETQPGVLGSSITSEVEKRLGRLSPDWPPGYHYKFGGEHEEQAKGFDSLALALVASLAMIYLALVIQFNSVTKPLVVFAGVPFGMIGGTMGLLPFHTPFGFMAFLGVASLAGVIVSHVIVLFDYIEEACERGESLHDAVIDSALVRLRPVLVTVLATVGGLIPLAIEGGPLWEPMCYVQITGLMLATVVTLGIVPVVYVTFVENLKLIRWEPQRHDVPAIKAAKHDEPAGSGVESG
jgi:multidrug efflux pump subunit AcrB